MKLAIPLTVGLASGAVVVVMRRRRRTLSEQERSLLELELLAALDEVEAERALLNAEFARQS